LLGLHRVTEGNVAVYYRFGALQNVTKPPGIHWKLPIVYDHHLVQVTVQTDEVQKIPCGTRGGVMVYFDKIEVVNMLRPSSVVSTTKAFGLDYDRVLIFDKIHHEINQLCSRSTLHEVLVEKFDQFDDILKETLQKDCDTFGTGLDIIAVRVTKPVIPEKIRAGYEAMEVEKTSLIVSTERAKTIEIEAQTEKRKRAIEAEMAAEVQAIRNQQMVLEKKTRQEESRIENEMVLEKEKAAADAKYYSIKLEAEGNALLHTPMYVELQKAKSLAMNTKVYFGEKIPAMLLDTDRSADAAAPVSHAMACGARIPIGKDGHGEQRGGSSESCDATSE